MIPSGKAKVAGVIGWPVSHSLSPRLHGYWLDHYRIDGAYVPMAVSPERLIDAVRALPALGLRGANVTVPHKETVFAALDRVTERARRIGAVNTIIVAEDGTLAGDNTDGFGFMQNVLTAAPAWMPASGPAVVVGAGGAARAIVVSLLDAGVPELRLTNRSSARAEALADEIGGPIRVVAWDDRAAALSDAGFLVNTTTQGMVGHPPLDLPLNALPTDALVTDIVYTPLITPLLAEAERRGNITVDGLGMLLHQARPGFDAWFGHVPEVTPALRRFVLEGI